MENYSVLMSVYYKEKADYLRESIQSMLEQTVPPDDFVLVCDGPLNEELDEVIADYEQRFPCVFQIVRLDTNMGLGNALNIGIRYCKNELIARMDSDDISLPGRCELQLKKFAEDQELDIVSGTIIELDNTSEDNVTYKSVPENNEDIYRYAKIRSPFNHATVMYKKKAVELAGGYRDFLLFEDYYLWVRMLQQNAKGFNFQQPLYLVRTDTALYERRGGLKYFKQVFAFRNYLLKTHFCNIFQYIVALVGQAIICFVPTKVRGFMYKKLLRKQVHQ